MPYLYQFRSTSWSLLRRSSTIQRRPSTMFASTSAGNFWSIWSIQPKDQIRQSLTHISDREFHGCTGSPFKRPQSSPVGNKSIILGNRNATIVSTMRIQSPSPILKKTLVKVKSDSSLPSTPLLGSDMRRHQNMFTANTSR